MRPAEDEDLNPHSIANIPRIKGLCAAKSVLVYGAIIVPKGKIVQEQSQADEEQAKELKCSENDHWSNGDIRNLWLAFLCHMNQESDIKIQRISFF